MTDMTDDLLKSLGLDIPPKSCRTCIYSRSRYTSLGEIIKCLLIHSDVGAAFYDPHDILNLRHPKCPYDKEGI